MRMLKFVAVAICAWVWFACASIGVASAQCPCNKRGPVRQLIHDLRPGIIVPKYDVPRFSLRAGSCVCGDSCTCASGACPAKCPVVSGPVQLTTPRVIVGYRCENGRCVPVFDR